MNTHGNITPDGGIPSEPVDSAARQHAIDMAADKKRVQDGMNAWRESVGLEPRFGPNGEDYHLAKLQERAEAEQQRGR